MAGLNTHNVNSFAHGAALRNDIRVKAIRRKYGNNGYAVLCFILEILAENENHIIKFDGINKELLAADFDIDSNSLEDMVNFFTQINILHLTNRNTLQCKELSEYYEKEEEKRVMCSERGKKGMASRWGNNKKENVKSVNKSDNAVIADYNGVINNYNDVITDYNGVIEEETKEQKEETEEKERTKEKEDKEEKIEKKEEFKPLRGSSTRVDAPVFFEDSTEFVLKSFKDFFNGEVRGAKSLIMQVRAITGKRATALKARAREYGEAAVKDAIRKAVKSDFLNGKNSKGFVASFDWIMRPNNFPKVLEGNYNNGRAQPYNAKDMHSNGQILHTEKMDYTRDTW